MSDNPFYFLHIPKCAGTATRRYLEANISNKDILASQTWNELYEELEHNQQVSFAEIRKHLRSFKLISGHLGYGLTRHLVKNTQIVTILREPIARTISQLCHIKLDPTYNNWVKPRFCYPHEDISAIVDDPLRLRFFENYQARYIAHSLDYPKIVAASGFDGSNLFFDSSKAFQKKANDINYLLRKATKHLDKFMLVGIHDYVDETLIMLGASTGWHIPAKTPRAPATATTNPKQKATLTPEHILKIEKITKADAKLYKTYKEKFERDYLALINSYLGQNMSWATFMHQRNEINQKLRSRINK